jgi:excisionase family DNA binding protein
LINCSSVVIVGIMKQTAIKGLMTASEAASYLGVSRNWIGILSRRGTLQFVDTPLGRLFAEKTLQEYKKNKRPVGRPMERI